jgi:hypothetical protein
MGLVARLDGSRLVWTAMLATNFCSAVLEKKTLKSYIKEKDARENMERTLGAAFFMTLERIGAKRLWFPSFLVVFNWIFLFVSL